MVVEIEKSVNMATTNIQHGAINYWTCSYVKATTIEHRIRKQCAKSQVALFQYFKHGARRFLLAVRRSLSDKYSGQDQLSLPQATR